MRDDTDDITIQDFHAGLVGSARNDLIPPDLTPAVLSGRFPLLLTGRTEHLAVFAEKLTGLVKNVLILKGGLGRKQRRAMAEQLASIPETEQRVILATGSYIGEGFDDACLDTLFLSMPVSWNPAAVRWSPAPSARRERTVEVYDYIDPNVRMLVRMYHRRLKGYADMGYRISEPVLKQLECSL
jgi:hypothetical protein